MHMYYISVWDTVSAMLIADHKVTVQCVRFVMGNYAVTPIIIKLISRGFPSVCEMESVRYNIKGTLFKWTNYISGKVTRENIKLGGY